MRLAILCLLIISLASLEVTGQQTQAQEKDSAQIKLEKIERERIQDSLSIIDIEESISELNQSETQKRKDLEQQLQQIKDRDSIRLQKIKNEIDSLRKITKGYPVMGPMKDTLFLLYTRQGGFTPEFRANAISNRIEKLAKEIAFQPDSLNWERNESTIEIAYGETVIMTIRESDAIWNNKSLEELANIYTDTIRQAITRYKSETSFSKLAKEVGIALGIIFLMGLLIALITRFFHWVNSIIQRREGKSFKGIIFKGYTFVDSKYQVAVLQKLLAIVKWAVILLIVYLSLPLLFSLFPWTEGIGKKLIGYILSPAKGIAISIWNYLPNLFTIGVIGVIFHYVLKFFIFLKVEIETGKLKINGFYPEWANPTFHIIRVLHFAFLLIIIFPYLPGSNSPVFKGVSVFLGFLFTFGSAGSLSNIMAGIVITYMRQFTLGDRVKIGEVTGDVIEKSLLVTRIKTVKNEIISIPNSTIMSNHTINYSSEAANNGLILHTTVTIGYDTPWRLMHETLIKAAKQTEFILNEPTPFVLQTSLNDFYVSYELNAYTREANRQRRIYSLLHQNIQDCCKEAGIEIMSPHYNSLRDGSKSTIPESK
ncbi:MAG: mechanosensitive ion channel [Chitinophagaceae bacterium]|nr:mechanosensitive ion channel [Chitinophagaceae bacterium]